jgi:putative NADH-flavin reductase
MKKPHRILLFGITGQTGRIIASELLRQGHSVTAVVRDSSKLTLNDPNLSGVVGDIKELATYINSFKTCDVVISAVGDRSRQPTTLYSGGIACVLEGMNQHGVTRLICISAQAIEVSPAIAGWQKWLTKYIIQKLFKHSYKDLRIMERLVRTSKVNWTIVRPPRLKDSQPTGVYEIAINSHLKQPLSISRFDLAAYMISIIDNIETFKTVIEIAD